VAKNNNYKSIDMKKFLILLLLVVSLSVQAATYYVSTTGSNSNPGTFASPWATWQYGFAALNPGDILYIRGGAYTVMYSTSIGVRIKPSSSIGHDGTSGSLISVLNYPNEIPILDCTGLSSGAEHDGIEFEGLDYWNVTGLTVINSKNRGSGEPSPGWSLGDCSNITINQCIVHDNDAGFISYNGDEIHYINCDSYSNGVITLYKGNNGFYASVTGGGHTYFDGCRSYWNGQDGWDSFVFTGGGDGYISYNRCWSWRNGKTLGGSGFKTGVTSLAALGSSAQRTLTNCISACNPAGYDESQDWDYGYSIPHVIYNCVSYKNTTGFEYSAGAGQFGTEHIDIIKNNVSYADTYITNNATPTGFGNNTTSTNSWDIKTVTSGDFQSVDTAQLSNPRQSDGSLPIITALHLATSSTLKWAGTYIASNLTDGEGNLFHNPPSVGAFEIGGSSPILVTALAITSAGNATTVSTYHGTLQFTATITPSNATNQVIDWGVVNGTGSASINSSGLLTAITNGMVAVYAYGTGDNSNKYAISSVITISNQVQSGYPTIITINPNIYPITVNSATAGGNITSDGGSAITDRGICWGTSPDPTITDSHNHVGTGIGSFSSNMTGLTFGTYHVRAFATNSTGTTYGADISFSTRENRVVVF
jgi:hypothetical protein